MQSFEDIKNVEANVLKKFHLSKQNIKNKKFIISDEIEEELKIFLKKKLLLNDKIEKNEIMKQAPIFYNLINQTKLILNKLGYIVFDINTKKKFNDEEQKKIYLLIGSIYGNFFFQNAKNDILVKVYDRGKSLKEGARYHESNVSGHLHTDSPQWILTPSIVGLFCVKQALYGGETLLVNAYNILEDAINAYPDFYYQMLLKYHFDKRGDTKDGEDETTFASIISFKNNLLFFRYLREYIESGHKKKNYKLSIKAIETLDYIDSLLTKKNLQTQIKLISGECIFFNNNFMVHGRTKFKDHNDLSEKRLFLRLWIG